MLKRKRKGADKRSGSRTGYHVCFFLSQSKYFYKVVGANQRNRVSIAYYSKKHYAVKALRWPLGA